MLLKTDFFDKIIFYPDQKLFNINLKYYFYGLK